MKRLMTTTAAVIALSTAAFAQDSGPFTQYEVQPEQDFFATELMGARIYATEGEVSGPVESSATAEWDDLGEINDMVLNSEGSVQVVVLGIGGFLGIGERNVAIPMDQLQIVRNGSDMTDYFLVVNADQQTIESAPEFVRPGEQSAEGEMSGGEAGQSMENSAEQTGQSMENSAEQAGQSMENAADSAAQEAGQAAEEAGQAAEEAGQAAEDAANEATGNN